MGDTGNATACHLHFAVKSGADIDGNLFADTNGHWEDPWTHLSQNGADMAQKPITDTTPKLIDWLDGTPYFDVDGTTKLGTANATSNRYSPHGCGTQRAFYAGTPPTAKLALVTPSAVHPVPAPPAPVALAPGVYKVG
jgi:murein DD-endopeptidase MepM/ murein hydrolase activator NlpD